ADKAAAATIPRPKVLSLNSLAFMTVSAVRAFAGHPLQQRCRGDLRKSGWSPGSMGPFRWSRRLQISVGQTRATIARFRAAVRRIVTTSANAVPNQYVLCRFAVTRL